MREPLKTTALMLCLLLAAALSLSAYREPVEKVLGRSDLTQVFTYLDEHPPDAKIILLGSSRFVSAIRSDLAAKLAGPGIQPEEILNLGVPAGGFWEFLLICRKYPALLKNAPVVIIEIEPWMFNKNRLWHNQDLLFPFSDHFYTWATLGERLEYPDLQTKLLLLADAVWPFSQRLTLTEWATALYGMLGGKRVEGGLHGPFYQNFENTAQDLAWNPYWTAKNFAASSLHDFQLDQLKVGYLHRLLQLLEDHHVKKIIFLQPPVRKGYMDAIYTNPAHLQTYTEALSILRGMENDRIKFLLWETAKDCGLDESLFLDYGHFNRRGTPVFTEKLFSTLKAKGWLEGAAGQ